jgi:uncharacterized protein (TIGR00251 family)
MVMTCLRATPQGTEITVHVQPGAAHAEVVGLHGDALKVRIPARAVEGAANAALLKFIALTLGVPLREVKILRGEKSRRKTLETPLPVDTVAAILTGRL